MPKMHLKLQLSHVTSYLVESYAWLMRPRRSAVLGIESNKNSYLTIVVVHIMSRKIQPNFHYFET